MTALYLIAQIAGRRIAFPTAEIKAVIDVGKFAPAPSTPAFVAGIAALRSRPMAVIDCAVSLELAEVPHPPRRALVVEIEGFLYALSVECVEDVAWIDEEVEPVPAQLPGGWARAARGMVRVQGEMLLVADIATLVAGPTAQAA